MKILLVQPPNNMQDLLGDAQIFAEPMEPLGLLYIAAVLRDHGFEVVIEDLYSKPIPIDRAHEVIANHKADVVGIGCLTSSAQMVWKIAREVRRLSPGTKVVLGNLHASLFAEFFLSQGCCDAVVHGEGEITMLELCQAWKDGREIDLVAGISYIEGGDVRKTMARAPIADLDSLPLPARDLVDRQCYEFSRNVNLAALRGRRYAAMLTSRGCVFPCTFCAVSSGRRLRARSAGDLVAEIQQLKTDQGVDFVMFLDSLFTANRKRVKEFCDLLMASDLKIEWTCEAHINTIDEAMLREMKRAGCIEISMGLESGNQELLDQVRKGSKIPDIEKAVRMVRDAGIRASGLFILGFPGETYEQTMKTISFARQLPLDFAQFSIMTPYPGTEIYNQLVAAGELVVPSEPEALVEHWSKYNSYPSFKGVEPVWVPKGRTFDDLNRMQQLAIRRFYMRPAKILERLRMVNPGNLLPLMRMVSKMFLRTVWLRS